jgi:predicted Zn-dependent protease
MKSLLTRDIMHLRAAVGWLELGNPAEADKELDEITPELRMHPNVLHVRWQICSTTKRWDACVDIGRALVEQEPDNSFGWVNRAYALRRASGGSVQAAYDALRPAADRTLDSSEQVLFNLACYTCQLGRLDEAREWLCKCFSAAAKAGKAKDLKQQVLKETDLEPLWKEVASS